MLQRNLSGCRQNLRNANEIVGGGGQDEEPFDQRPSAMAGLAQATDRLHPAEGFFDPLTLDRADAITWMPCRAAFDRRTASGIVLGDMRRAATLAATGNEVSGIIVLVAAHRAAWLDIVLDHRKRGRALGCAVGLAQPRIDDE